MGLVFFAANLQVNTYQAVDYKVSAIKIPLYVKITEFFDRSYHYGKLSRDIAEGSKTDEEKVLRLFEWTTVHIRKVPDGFPVVDDHVWNVIIRGYGTDDQSADVLATLCTYAGFNAGWVKLWTKGKEAWHAVTIVEYNGRKLVFDPFAGNYFRNNEGEIASIEDIMHDLSLVERAKNKPVLHGIEYISFFENLTVIDLSGVMKAAKQVPLKRMIYGIRKLYGR